MQSDLEFTFLQKLAHKHGLNITGLLSDFDLVNDQLRLAAWQGQGYAADMNYMLRDPQLFTQLNKFLPQVQTVLSFVVSYSGWPTAKVCPPGFGRVARYAWGLDYHKVLRTTLQDLVDDLVKQGFSFKSAFFTDAVPLVERAIARKSGLGFIGKNTMLIRPGLGSFTFLAELLLDVKVNGVPLPTPAGHCGSCSRCISACPTDAIVAPFSLDANRCISYMSIEKRGELNTWEQTALGDWVFGCDICQEVCPFNHTVMKEKPQYLQAFTPLPFIKAGLIDLGFILNIKSDRDFKTIFSDSAIQRTKRHGLIRNALCVIANQTALGLLPVLYEFLANEPDHQLRRYGHQTLFRLSKKCDTVDRQKIQQLILLGCSDANFQLATYCQELINEF